MGDLPESFQKTLLEETFLLHDSGPPEDVTDDDDNSDDNEADGRRQRVLVFATQRNVELLCQSSIWFLDGTFKVAPTIFA